jgi:transcriptional regulator with XRE-family HTH domain
MTNPLIEARPLRAAEICRRRGITQAQIADALGASQSQVSRILSGRSVRQSRLLEEVCLYVEHFDVGVTVDAVRHNEELLEALRVTWDGSAVHAKALSTVIRSLAVLRTGLSSSSGLGDAAP